MSGAKKKSYYAVKVGKTPGIYRSWAECAAQVKEHPGALYKGFSTLEEAEKFMDTPEEDIRKSWARGTAQTVQAAQAARTTQKSMTDPREDLKTSEPYAFVDGSYNDATGTYGFGGFLVNGEDRYPVQGSGKDITDMHNVNGEIHGAIEIVKLAIDLKLTQIILLYDYAGIENWVTEKWEAKNPQTQAYRDFMQSCGVNVIYKKVEAHTGIPGNELADRMAKEACGIT